MHTTCKDCSGIGFIMCTLCSSEKHEQRRSKPTCQNCNNTKTQRCKHCKGSGKYYTNDINGVYQK